MSATPGVSGRSLDCFNPSPAISPVRTTWNWSFLLRMVRSYSSFSSLYYVSYEIPQHRPKLVELSITTHGCKLPPACPCKDPVFGLDSIRESIRARKACLFLDRERDLHEAHGYTYSSRLLRTAVLNTIEPDNLKSVLSTNSGDYGVGSRRKRAFAPLLGNSIFESDGPHWEFSRALLWPCFQHAQTTDTNILEPHVSTLTSCILMGGETLDLAVPFQRLTADIATDLIFWELIKSLEDPSTLDSSLIKLYTPHSPVARLGGRWEVHPLSYCSPNSIRMSELYTISSKTTWTKRWGRLKASFRNQKQIMGTKLHHMSSCNSSVEERSIGKYCRTSCSLCSLPRQTLFLLY